MEGVRHKAGELNHNHKLPTSLSYSGVWLALTSPSPLSVLACALLFLPSRLLALAPSSDSHALPDRTHIGNSKNKVSFKNVGSGAYSCGGKGTRILVLSVQRCILLPSLPTSIPLLRAWPLLQHQTGDKH